MFLSCAMLKEAKDRVSSYTQTREWKGLWPPEDLAAGDNGKEESDPKRKTCRGRQS